MSKSNIKKTNIKKTKINSVSQAAGILMITYFLSRILGYARDIVITSNIGLGVQTDSYYAAFTIPDLIYTLLVGGALSAAFIPVYSQYVNTDEQEEANKVASTIINIIAILASIMVIVGLVFTPQLIGLITEFKGYGFRLTVILTRIMFVQCLFMCVTGISQGILQAHKKFSISAIGGLLYNIAIIAFGVILNKKLGIMAFSIGVVVGSVINFMIHIPYLKGFGFKYIFKIDYKHKGVKKFFLLLLPVLFGLAISEINLIVNQYFASGLGESIMSAMKNSQRLIMLPIDIFGMTVGVAIFPTMLAHIAKDQMDEYKNDIASSLSTILFVTIPATVGMMTLREPLIRMMYLQGKFTEKDVKTMSILLLFYCIGIVGYSSQGVLDRGFYALKDTKSVVKINSVALIINIVLSLVFINSLGARGLALSYALSGLASMAMLIFFLRRKVGGLKLKPVIITVVKTIIASGAMYVAIYFTRMLTSEYIGNTGKINQILDLGVNTIIGVVVFATCSVILKINEVTVVIDIIKKKIRKS